MRYLVAAAAIALTAVMASPSFSQEAQPGQAREPQIKDQQNPTAPESATPPFLTVLGSSQTETILGRDVRSKANENIGRIVDVLVDRSGKVRAAVVDFGGFLGVGSRKIAVDWSALKFASGDDGRNTVTLDLTREQMKAAPEYKDKRAVVVLGAASPAQISPSQ